MIFTEENLNKLLSFLPLFFKENIINKYQKRFTKNLTYHIPILKDFRTKVDFKNKTILEIGGGNIPKDYMFFYGAKKYICLDNISEWWNGYIYESDKEVIGVDASIEAFEKEESFIIDGRVENIPDFFYNKFDIIISIATFEHVSNLEESLNIIYKLLSNNGSLLSTFGPIYSCANGHHFWFNDEYNYENKNIANDLKFFHLIYSYDEAKEAIKNIFTTEKYGDLSEKLQEHFLEESYKSNFINKLMYNDYIRIFNSLNFKKMNISESENDISDMIDIIPIVEKKYGKMKYNVSSFSIHAIK